jgi:hypothetical protein
MQWCMDAAPDPYGLSTGIYPLDCAPCEDKVSAVLLTMPAKKGGKLTRGYMKIYAYKEKSTRYRG